MKKDTQQIKEKEEAEMNATVMRVLVKHDVPLDESVQAALKEIQEIYDDKEEKRINDEANKPWNKFKKGLWKFLVDVINPVRALGPKLGTILAGLLLAFILDWAEVVNLGLTNDRGTNEHNISEEPQEKN